MEKTDGPMTMGSEKCFRTWEGETSLTTIMGDPKQTSTRKEGELKTHLCFLKVLPESSEKAFETRLRP